MKANERVILIKGDASKWYDQAIFIVNKKLPPEKTPVDFVAEAEKIINSYMTKKNNTPPLYKPVPKTRATKQFDFVLNIVMLVGCLAIAGAFLFGMAG